MIAHLYRFPSDFANVPPKIIVKKSELSSYPGNALHAAIDLPDGYSVLETDFGDGFILTPGGDAITAAYPAGPSKVSGSAIKEPIIIRDNGGRTIFRGTVSWM